MRLILGILGAVIVGAIGIFFVIQPQESAESSTKNATPRVTNPAPDQNQILEKLQELESKLEKISEKIDSLQIVRGSEPRQAVPVPANSPQPASAEAQQEHLEELKVALQELARHVQTQKNSAEAKKRYEEVAEHFNSTGRYQNVSELRAFLEYYDSKPLEAAHSVLFKSQMEIAKRFGLPTRIDQVGSNLEMWLYTLEDKGWRFEFRDGYVYN